MQKKLLGSILPRQMVGWRHIHSLMSDLNIVPGDLNSDPGCEGIRVILGAKTNRKWKIPLTRPALTSSYTVFKVRKGIKLGQREGYVSYLLFAAGYFSFSDVLLERLKRDVNWGDLT